MSHRTFLPAAVAVSAAVLTAAAQEPGRATFRSAADLVSIAVVVRDGSGRLVTGLQQRDFEVFEGGTRRAITHFEQGSGSSARVALLVDSSGSMAVAPKRERAQAAADLLISGMRPDDAASVFSFDSAIRRLTSYTGDALALRSAVSSVTPFGATCLFDAIVGTAGMIQADAPRARALVLLTDGVDTSSVHSVDDAATAAAKLDTPVYVVGVGGAADARIDNAKAGQGAFTIAELARRTGGLSTEAASREELGVVARRILEELHHQYVLAFPAGAEPGWHGLQVAVRRGKVRARSRDGYFVH